MSMTNAQYKAVNASLSAEIDALKVEIETLKAQPAMAAPEPLKLTSVVEGEPGPLALPDGTAANRVRHHHALLGEALADVIGEDSNGDVHAVMGAHEALIDAFEATPYALEAEADQSAETEG